MTNVHKGYIHAFTDAAKVNAKVVNSKGKLAFDIGANGGHLAKILARPGAFEQVVAVEPCIESFNHMKPRCPIDNLICLNKAVSDHEGTVTLGVKSWTETHGELFTGDSLGDLWGPDFGTREVECTTLDKLAEEYGYPDFVKIDTEGHEAYIVDGGYKVLKPQIMTGSPSFIIEIHDKKWGEHIEEVFFSMGVTYNIMRHEQYDVGSFNYLNHYWMVDTK